MKKFVLFVIVSLMSFKTITTHQRFENVQNNLTKITWAHAVNNRTLLEKALKGPVMMLEADIILGQLINSTTNRIMPVMGHPPANSSDLSLQEFLGEVLNCNTEQNASKKGVKLDFKSAQALQKSEHVLRNAYVKISKYPFWINADIIAGPGNALTTPVNPTQFFSVAKKYDEATLSIGWTTGSNFPATYTDTHVNEMLRIIRDNNVTQRITFPVRAAIAAESGEQMLRLLTTTANSTLTVWSGKEDAVDVGKLRDVIKAAGLDRVYVDVPEELREKLRLDELTSEAAMAM